MLQYMLHFTRAFLFEGFHSLLWQDHCIHVQSTCTWVLARGAHWKQGWRSDRRERSSGGCWGCWGCTSVWGSFVFVFAWLWKGQVWSKYSSGYQTCGEHRWIWEIPPRFKGSTSSFREPGAEVSEGKVMTSSGKNLIEFAYRTFVSMNVLTFLLLTTTATSTLTAIEIKTPPPNHETTNTTRYALQIVQHVRNAKHIKAE